MIREIRAQAIAPALALLPARMTSPEAEVMLLAIGLQESGFAHRDQLESNGHDLVDGPAMGLWQFERGGAVAGVLQHEQAGRLARDVLKACGLPVSATPLAVWHALEHDDVLAAAMARLLLWTDPRPLPAMDEEERAWVYYLRTWRPGKPHRHRWGACYAAALREIREPA